MNLTKNKSDIIIINAFPSNNDKILLLGEQINSLRGIDKPILLISGCPVPEFIVKSVDYFLLNTENEIIGKDWSYFLRKNGVNDFGFDYSEIGADDVHFYSPNVNSTITKNIKLSFNLAKLLGYKNAFYTEDDNIWKRGSFDYINDNLNKLNGGYFKMAGVIAEQIGLKEPMIFTTFFFTNIDFFTEKFVLPHDVKDWYNLDNVLKFKLNKTYEILFYHFFNDELQYFYNTEKEFNQILFSPTPNVLFGLNDRRHSEKNLLDTFFTILPNLENNKTLMLLNRSDYLKTGGKDYDCLIYYNDNPTPTNLKLKPIEYFSVKLNDSVTKIKVSVIGYGDIILDCDINSVLNNGLIVHL